MVNVFCQLVSFVQDYQAWDNYVTRAHLNRLFRLSSSNIQGTRMPSKEIWSVSLELVEEINIMSCPVSSSRKHI